MFLKGLLLWRIFKRFNFYFKFNKLSKFKFQRIFEIQRFSQIQIFKEQNCSQLQVNKFKLFSSVTTLNPSKYIKCFKASKIYMKMHFKSLETITHCHKQYTQKCHTSNRTQENVFTQTHMRQTIFLLSPFYSHDLIIQ